MDTEDTKCKANTIKPRHTKWDVVDALAEWVIRVASNKTASDKELDILPEVVNAITYLANDGRNYR